MAITTVTINLALSSDDIAEPYKDCRLYTDKGDALGFGKDIIVKTPMSTVLKVELDIVKILRYIKENVNAKK